MANTVFDGLGFHTQGSMNVFSADTFGGTWDGTHDVGEAINRAVAAAVLVNGEVALPAGTWPLQTPITATGGFTLRGRGPGTILQVQAANTSTSGYLLSLSNISNVVISDLVFDGGGESIAQSSPLTQLFQTTNVTFRDVTWQNCAGIGLNASGVNQTKIINPILNKVGNRWKATSSSADCHQGLSLTNGNGSTLGFDNSITGGKFADIGLDVINLGTQTRTTILNNKFFLTNSVTAIVGGGAVYAGLCVGLTISDNLVNNASGNGLDIVSSRSVIVRGNTIVASSGCGIGIFQPSTNTVAFTGSISGTTLTVPGGTLVTIGMAVTAAAGAATAVTSGTYITAGSGTSWTVNNSQTVTSESLLAAVNPQAIIVSDNVCLNNYQAGLPSTWTGGISIGDGMPDGVVLKGNICTDTQPTKTQAYGIQVASSGNAPAWAVNVINAVFDASNEVAGNLTANVLGVSLGVSGAVAATTLTSSGVTALKGSVTNDTAAAGNYGEYLSNTSGAGGTATITLTIAAPAVVTWAAHGMQPLAPVYFSTTGALPTGLSAFTAYYVAAGTVTANTFQIATTEANALAGTCITTTGTQSGTQTAHQGVILASAAASDVVGLMLPAGDYDVSGVITYGYGGSTSVTIMSAWLGTAGASTLPYNISSATITAAALADGLTAFSTAAIVEPQVSMTTATIRVSLPAPGMVILSTQATYTVSSVTAFGTVRARRAR